MKRYKLTQRCKCRCLAGSVVGEKNGKTSVQHVDVFFNKEGIGEAEDNVDLSSWIDIYYIEEIRTKKKPNALSSLKPLLDKSKLKTEGIEETELDPSGEKVEIKVKDSTPKSLETTKEIIVPEGDDSEDLDIDSELDEDEDLIGLEGEETEDDDYEDNEEEDESDTNFTKLGDDSEDEEETEETEEIKMVYRELDDGSFECLLCGKTYKRINMLSSHLLKIHEVQI